MKPEAVMYLLHLGEMIECPTCTATNVIFEGYENPEERIYLAKRTPYGFSCGNCDTDIIEKEILHSIAV